MKPIHPISRRSFVTTAAAGLAAFGAIGPIAPAARAQEIETSSEWPIGDFNQLVHHPAEVKQMFDLTKADGGGFQHIQNSLNSLHFGFGIPADQIQIVAVARAMATVLLFDDYAWKKYSLGVMAKINDPKTGKPAEHNIFYPSKTNLKYASDDPNHADSIYQDSSIQALQHRGLRLVGCHMATWFVARYSARKNHLTQPTQEIYNDLAAHTLPGVLLVAAAVGAIGLLQSKGHYSYLYVG
ncbi:MAG: hypothetical protein ACP5M4_07665 [Acidobacteriaceae bacterium]